MSSAENHFEIFAPLSSAPACRSFLAARKGIAGFRQLVVLRRIAREAVLEGRGTRLVAEVSVAAAIVHPHLAACGGLEVFDNALYLVTEFCPGATLYEVHENARATAQRANPGLFIRAVRDVALALDVAHRFTDALGRRRPLVHRSLDDRSILVSFDGAAKLLDLGLPAEVLPADRRTVFSAPEVLHGEEVDARANVYSLGVILHAVLTGHPVSRAGGQRRIAVPSGSHPQLSADVDAVVARALEPDPDLRIQTAGELAQELERAAAGLLGRAEHHAAALQKAFFSRREQLRSLVIAEEERITTAVMPLSSILAEEDAAPMGRNDQVTAELRARKTQELVDLDELPPTGQLERQPRDEKPRKRHRPILKVLVALLLLGGAALAGAWVVVPEWVRFELGRLRAFAQSRGLALGPSQPEGARALTPVADADAGPEDKLDASVELTSPSLADADAGEAADAGVSEDAGTSMADEPPKPSRGKKKKRRH